MSIYEPIQLLGKEIYKSSRYDILLDNVSIMIHVTGYLHRRQAILSPL
jgi:hypothetical protein